jgi:hypothetical protein
MPDPKILLLAALLASRPAFVLFWIAQERARPHARPLLTAGTRWSVRHRLPRHARHRIVRGDDDDLPAWRMVPDQNIPGTLNVGHALPTVVQALLFITAVAGGIRDARASHPVGGRRLVDRRVDRRGSAQAQHPARHGDRARSRRLLMTLTALNRMPGGGDALALTGTKLVSRARSRSFSAR